MILGTRMWYPFFDSDRDDEVAFARRVDPVVREIGMRGRNNVQDSVPSAEQPPSTPLTRHANATDTATTPSYTPSVQSPSLSMQAAVQCSNDTGSELVGDIRNEIGAMTAFISEQQDKLIMLLRTEREHAEAAQIALKTQLEEQRTKEKCTIEVAALQSRLQSLLLKDLITQEEVDMAEDEIADSTIASCNSVAYPSKVVPAMVSLSKMMSSDASFARQLHRLFAN